MTPWQFVWTRGRQVVAATDRNLELFLWEQSLNYDLLISDFIQNIDVDLPMEDNVEERVKSGLQAIEQ